MIGEKVVEKPPFGAKPREAGSRRHPASRPPLLEASLLGLSSRSEDELMQEVERGFKFRHWESLQTQTSVTASQLAEQVMMNVKTVGRRKKADLLLPEEADRLVRVSRVFARAIELFEGDREAARFWLNSPAKAFGGKSPLTVARTEIGARAVERLIGQLEHGVFP